MLLPDLAIFLQQMTRRTEESSNVPVAAHVPSRVGPRTGRIAIASEHFIEQRDAFLDAAPGRSLGRWLATDAAVENIGLGIEGQGNEQWIGGHFFQPAKSL